MIFFFMCLCVTGIYNQAEVFIFCLISEEPAPLSSTEYLYIYRSEFIIHMNVDIEQNILWLHIKMHKDINKTNGVIN